MALPIQLGPRTRKALRISGYVLLGLLAFVYALHLTFPYDRLKDKGIEALSSRYEVSVGGVERGWLPGDFALTRVQLRTRPSKADEVPKIIYIDRLEVDIRLLASLWSRAAVVDLEATVGPGHINATIELGRGRTQLALDSHSLPLSEVPGLSSVIGLPMAGNGTVTASLDLPGGDWRRATARFTVDCPTCTIGGEGAKIKPRTMSGAKAAWVGDGIEVPRLFFDRLQAEFVITGGKFKMSRWATISPDGDLIVEVSGTMERTLSASKVESGCIKFRGTDALAEREPKFDGSLDLIGGVLMPDGLRHLTVAGTLGTMKYLPKACEDGGPAGGAGDDDGSGRGVSGKGGPRTRPSLSNVPDAPSDNNGAATNPLGGGMKGVPAEVPVDAMPTPKIDDVKPGVEEDNGNAPEPAGPVGAPEHGPGDGNAASGGEPDGNGGTVQPLPGPNDSVILDNGQGGDPKEPPPENE